jgi:[ribosomal protein S18]-alanine N-acetyltransferase
VKPRPPVDDVAIVPLERRHLRTVMTIDAQVYPEPWSRRLWLVELERSHRIYLAAETGRGRSRSLVGYAGAMLSGEDLHVMTIVAAPTAQQRGVGSRLMAELVTRGVAAGASALTLEVRASNEPAKALYRRFGLAPAGVRRGYYEPDGEDALVMWVHDIDADDYRERLDAITGRLSGTAQEACT